MKKEVEIKKLGINGEGIGYIDKKICFIPNALPQEVVEVEILDAKKKFLSGTVTKYIKESPNRQKSICPEYKECFGCHLTCLKESEHAYFKKDLIRDALRKYYVGDLSSMQLQNTIQPSKMQHYKHVVSLPVTYYKGKVSFGIYQRESKYLTFMSQCPVQDERINECLLKLEEIVNKHGVKTYSEKFKKGFRFLKLKLVEDGIQALFVTGEDGIKKEVVDEFSKLDVVKSIYMTINTSRKQDFELLGYKKMYGISNMPWRVFDQNILYSVKSEFPVNPEMEIKIMEKIKSMVKPEDFVLSLYCHVGALELSMPNQIVAIDERKYRIADAQDNAKFLRKENVKFISSKVDEAVITQCKKNKFDTMIVRHEDLSDAVKQSMILSKVKNVIFVSDHPSAVAKDIEELKRYYKVDAIIPYDVLPYSSKVTSLVKLVRK